MSDMLCSTLLVCVSIVVVPIAYIKEDWMFAMLFSFSLGMAVMDLMWQWQRRTERRAKERA